MKRNSKKTKSKRDIDDIIELGAKSLRAEKEAEKAKLHITRYRIPITRDYYHALRENCILDENDLIQGESIDIRSIIPFSINSRDITDVAILCYSIKEDLEYSNPNDDTDFVYYNNHNKKIVFVHQYRNDEYKRY